MRMTVTSRLKLNPRHRPDQTALSSDPEIRDGLSFAASIFGFAY